MGGAGTVSLHNRWHLNHYPSNLKENDQRDKPCKVGGLYARHYTDILFRTDFNGTLET